MSTSDMSTSTPDTAPHNVPYLPTEILASIIEDVDIGTYRSNYRHRIFFDAILGSKWVRIWCTFRLVSKSFKALTESVFIPRLIREMEVISHPYNTIMQQKPEGAEPPYSTVREWASFRLFYSFARMSGDGRRVVLREWAAHEHHKDIRELRRLTDARWDTTRTRRRGGSGG